jgi:hypothetical protein
MNKSTLAGAAMIAAVAVAMPAVLAWSQSPPPPPPAGAAAPDGPGGPGGPGHEGMRRGGWGRWARDVSPQQACIDRLARRAGFIAATGFKLNLTPDQKPLWDKLMTATQSAQDAQRKLCDALPASKEARGQQTLIDRMNHRQQVLQAQLQAMQQTEPAVQALYDKLTPEQKAIVDHPFHRG